MSAKQKQWVPVEKKPKIKWLPANKPLALLLLLIFTALSVMGLKENPGITTFLLLFVALPAIYIVDWGITIAKAMARTKAKDLHLK
jgi:hypothetical protein